MSKKDKAEKKTESTDCQEPEVQAEETQCAEPEVSLEDKLKAKEDQYLRVCAEYDNFRKRSQKEREGLYSMIQAEIIGSFIPVLDNMERACAAEGADDGVKMILKQLETVLEKYGVAAVGQPGETFDPTLHNAVSHEGDGSGESQITDVLQKGYKLGERLIRPAMVKTADAP